MSDFLDSFFPNIGPKKKIDPKKLSRRTIRADRYDDRTYERALEIMPDFDTARSRLCDRMTETGNGMTGDVFHLLYKVEPSDRPNEEIRPDYVINALVRDQLRVLPELEELRGLGTVGDELNAGLGFITLRKAIESVHDKTKVEQALMEELLKQQAELQKLQKQRTPLDKAVKDLVEQLAQAMQVLAEAQSADDPDPDGEDGEGEDGEAQAAALALAEQAVDALESALAAAQAKQDANQQDQQTLEETITAAKQMIEDGLDQKSPEIRQALEKGLDEAIDQAKDMQSLQQAWGIDPGHLQRLDPAARIALAKQIKDDPKLKQLAELIGRYTRVAFAENRKQVQHARSEVSNVEMGNDLTLLLPSELVQMRHPILKRDFRRRYMERTLLQFKMDGTERSGLGSIICCYDGSMSMSGQQEIRAKAVAIALLNMAKEQKRAFKGIQFGSSSEIAAWDFAEPADFTPEKIFEMASFFFNGGTDFVTPLSLSLAHLQAEHDASKAVRGDIVFITDGECGVGEAWLKSFKDEQARLGFHVFGVVIGGDPTDEPLFEICDGRVVAWNNLESPDELRSIFQDIHRPS
jgi:uncharacterized protein with von Willebrand factor type A (vWA) domain